jgi:small-conductance mechanosensitive channel
MLQSMLGTAVAQAGGFGGNMGMLMFIGVLIAVVWFTAQSSDDSNSDEDDEDGRRVVRVRRVRVRRRRRKR